MTPTIRLCLVLHNHQPVGNFDHVFEQAYEDSYRPFLDVFEPYESLNLSLHTSGPLIEWLAERHPEYLDRLATLVAAGRVEIIGGAFYEPILTMIPSRDRIGQITSFSRWLEDRLGGEVRGMWIPERVWEQSLAGDLAKSEIQYTLLDDFHFKNAGLDAAALMGHFVTEDDGRTVNVFPGSEPLRYLIPFRPPHETIDFLRQQAEQHPGSVAVFGDDGEKFGTWPDTKAHVYDDGWLREFFDALTAEKDWLKTTTLADAYRETDSVGKIYIPDGSYREMTEWALPVPQQLKYDSIIHEFETHEKFEQIKRFMKGGFWRNFKTKYPESGEMYARMMHVSSLLLQAEQEGRSGEEIEQARKALYRGQCNCSYWHGAFGGIYLPHLRNAVFSQLIEAENHLESVLEQRQDWVEANADDYNFDGHTEIRLASDQLVAWFEPQAGGRMYELDVRSIQHNLLATMARRPESYHEKVKQGESLADADCASIHDRVVFKQAGLQDRLQYDSDLKKSLVDHFFDNDTHLGDLIDGTAVERGDFAQGSYSAKIRRGPQKTQIQLHRHGNAWGIPLSITKGVTLAAGSNELEIAYLVENLPLNRDFHFGVELNFSGLPAGADDRFFHQSSKGNLGQLGETLDLAEVSDLSLMDEWLGIDVQWSSNQSTHVWAYPVSCVSQSEGGFELVHQSVVVMPHWWIRGDSEGKWSCVMRLKLDTQRADDRSLTVTAGSQEV